MILSLMVRRKLRLLHDPIDRCASCWVPSQAPQPALSLSLSISRNESGWVESRQLKTDP